MRDILQVFRPGPKGAGDCGHLMSNKHFVPHKRAMNAEAVAAKHGLCVFMAKMKTAAKTNNMANISHNN